MTRSLYWREIDSPIGALGLAVDDVGRLVSIVFLDASGMALQVLTATYSETELIADDARTAEVARQLDEYFAGDRRDFDLDLALDGTDFQRSVWELLLDIPCGETRSYLDLARTLGRPGASRAVGGANGSNPVPIVVPCHRVITTAGGLGGFGGGLDRKRWLLDFEQARGVALGLPLRRPS
ncbi:MAG: methylated-DNA--[protein]-cysteine S-methyltransferase [Acidobacteriota bacterium]